MGSTIGQPSPKVVRIHVNQPPPIPRFTGEEELSELESFLDWLEQYEPAATLFNLTTPFRGNTSSFFCSCTREQQSNYKLL